MAPSKLSDADKQTILELYRQPEETTSTLAERYSVSNSTISRLLKTQLPEAEYAALIQQKRGGSVETSQPVASPPPAKVAPVEVPEPKVPVVEEAAVEKTPVEKIPVEKTPVEKTPVEKTPVERAPVEVPSVVRDEAEVPPPAPSVVTKEPVEQSATPGKIPPPRRRSRSEAAETATAESSESIQLPLLKDNKTEGPSAPDYGLPPIGAGADEPELLPVAQEEAVAAVLNNNQSVGADYDDDLDDLDDLDDDDDDDDLDEDDDLDDEEMGNWKFSKGGTPQLQKVQISPLTTSALPRLCYVVVERNSSELVTCPLRDFAELGLIPENEIDSRTLPVFDNHRIARRFSRRNQRVVKVPDGRMLQKTSSYLQAKGITRLLIDGQIYTLENVAPVSNSSEFEED
ncbi:MAG: hypothetical protein ICV77_03005 [Cyanobacteria bacterium Co-bin8]|nr:hypothetical protein [Cyanobacteria bacterium Co-bin8]